MSKLAESIDTLRQEPAQRASIISAKSSSSLSCMTCPLEEVVHRFAETAWQMKELKPSRAGPVAAAEQNEHFQRLRDVVMMDADPCLVESAEVLMDFVSRRRRSTKSWMRLSGPNLDDDEDRVDEDEGNDERDGILLIGPGFKATLAKADYAAETPGARGAGSLRAHLW